MGNLTEGLRVVLQEELKPFKKDLQAIKEGQKRLERSFEDLRILAGRMNFQSHDDILPILGLRESEPEGFERADGTK